MVEMVLQNGSLEQVLFIPELAQELRLPIHRPLSTIHHRYRALVGEAHPCDRIRPASEWAKSGTRGMIIRVYHPTDGMFPFLHFRAMTRMTSINGSTGLGLRRQWQDMTWFQGVVVPRDILTKVYAAAMRPSAFTTPERKGTLPAASWKILREWRGTLSLTKRGLKQLRKVAKRSGNAEWMDAVKREFRSTLGSYYDYCSSDSEDHMSGKPCSL